MKAVTYHKYGPPEVLTLGELESVTPKANKIRIKIRACAITAGDTELRSPKIPTLVWFIVRLFFGIFSPRIKVLGGYLSGDVVEVGEEVSEFKVGDSVFGISGSSFGGYAEYVTLNTTEAFIAKPSQLPYDEASPIGLGLDSLHFIRKLKLKRGEKILINGAGGGIGTYAVQIAKNIGARVTVVDSVDKSQMLHETGADETIDYQGEEVFSRGIKYDAIFDVVGTISKWQCLKALNSGGRYVSAIPSLSYLFWTVWPRWVGNKKIMTGLASPGKEDLIHLRDLVESGKLKTIIDRRYTMDQLVEAHHYIESGKKKGNIVMIVPE
ncbi:MAG: NAD(P)-dependent alcohol dehydrogenase [Crocinitomicaceae bacterium]|nr:NAD(P)-dependent alcohol dehydrogenase [Crocinitomicaceae bacterium]|tara:strand:- start:3815 stop:4786 length:972 start_codon:yes stop_codon:yes gene_type:complete